MSNETTLSYFRSGSVWPHMRYLQTERFGLRRVTHKPPGKNITPRTLERTRRRVEFCNLRRIPKMIHPKQ